MERRVPIIDRRVIAPERELGVVVDVIPHDYALDFRVEASRRRRSRAGIGARREAQLSEQAHLRRKRRAEVQRELSFLKSAVRAEQALRAEARRAAAQVGGGEIQIAE